MKEFQLDKSTGYECDDAAGTMRALERVPGSMPCSVVKISARTKDELANLVRAAQDSQTVALFFYDETFNRFLQYAKSVSTKATDKTEIMAMRASEVRKVLGQ